MESAAYGVVFTSCLCQKPERARYERVKAFDTNNANLLAMENIAVHVHQGNKVLNGKMHLQKFFQQRDISLCFA